jgi:transposase
VVFADEMRLGAASTGETGMGETGKEVETACRTEVRVGVFGIRGGSDAGRLWWDWVKRVRGVERAQVLRAWKGAGVKGVVWDHPAFHKAKAVGEVGLRRVYQPPYSPELNPAERVLEEVRRWVEGRRYESIEAKKAAVEEVLRRLEAEGKVSSLVGWRYIRQALNALPS